MSSLLKNSLGPAPSFAPAASRNDEPAIPDPAVFTIAPLAATAGGVPTVSQCAVHLELLGALSLLHRRVTKEAALIEVFGTVDEERETWWHAFIEVAVGRFRTWWWGVDEELLRRHGEGKDVKELPDDLLPPLGMCRLPPQMSVVRGLIGDGCRCSDGVA